MIRTIALPTSVVFFFFNDTATTEIYTLSLHDALPISFLNLARASDLRVRRLLLLSRDGMTKHVVAEVLRSEEHTSELQSRLHLVCRLLLEKKNNAAHSVRRIEITDLELFELADRDIII